MSGVSGKTLGIRQNLAIDGNDGAVLNIAAGGTLGSGAFANTSSYLLAANNLSDVASVSTSRTNLGLGSAAVLNSNQVLQPSNNLSDVASVSTARTNLGLGSAALNNTSDFLQTANNLSDVPVPATARTNLGLGSAAVLNSNQVLQPANNLSDVASVSTSRTNLGLGSAAVQNDSYFLQTANNLSDVPVPATARTNLGLGSAAVLNSNQVLQSANNLSDLASALTARSNLGANDAGNLNTGTLSASRFPAFTVNPLALLGVVDNSNASAGFVGEYVESVVLYSSRFGITTNTDTTITSITLTAGDWDVSGYAFIQGNANLAFSVGGLNLFGNQLPDPAYRSSTADSPALSTEAGLACSTRRFSSASTFTVYLIGYATFSVGTATVCGSINARRVR